VNNGAAAAPLLLAYTRSRRTDFMMMKIHTSYVLGNIPAAERFHRHYQNGSCLYFTAAKAIAYSLHYSPQGKQLLFLAVGLN